MATAAPWSNPDFHQLLQQKIGSDWEQQLEIKWGLEWDQSCAAELSGELGTGWADNPEHAADTLAYKLGVATSEAEPEETPDPDSEVHLDFSEYQWLNTLNEADSFSSWLTRIGLTTEEVSEIVDVESGSETSGQQSTPDPDEIVNLDLHEHPWLNTFTEADSFESWLTRIGLPAEDVKSIVNAESQQSTEENR